MRRFLQLIFLPTALWIATGCGGQPPAPPSLDDAATRAAIEEEDARVHEEESRQ
jgi:hypothetical protein